MLNFDMIGSPNFVRFVYDGDLSDSPEPEPGVFLPEARPFSATIERIFLDYFASKGLATLPTDSTGARITGRSSLPASRPAACFTGAEGIKTPAQAAVFGGTAGERYDPSYHLGCDDIANLSRTALDQMADAAAHALITIAQSTIPDRPAPAPAPTARALRAGSGNVLGHPEPVALDGSSR